MSLFEKLLDIQQNLPEFTKNAANPHFKNTYITLDGVLDKLLPMLNERGLLLTQAPVAIVGGETVLPALRTTIRDIGTGEEYTTDQPLLLDRDNPQGHGSALTYGRRYALCGIFNIVADEDDDGNGGSSRASNGTSGASGRSTATTDGSATAPKF